MSSTKVRITKQFRFEAAHALWGYDGACRNVHGHSYILYVTLIGSPISATSHPKFGMVMDFSVLKDIVNELIIERFDHALMIRKNTPHQDLANAVGLIGKILELDYQPTCENMVIDFAGMISRRLTDGIKLHSIRLHETATSYAEWFADDNV